jgi:uncharacterized protein (TIGR03435 family)
VRRFNKSVCVLALSSAWAQPVSERRSFEVVSIRPTEGPGDTTFLSGIKVSGSSVVMRNVGLETLIRAAFGVESRFLAGTDWLKEPTHFDIRATTPSDATARQIPEMLQTLLKERFKFAFHFERQERQVYALLAGKDGPKFQKSPDIDESMPGGAFTGINAVSDEGGARIFSSPNESAMRITILPDGGGRWDMKGMSLPEFAYILNTLDGLDIIDMTGIAGKYDFITTQTWEEACELCNNATQSQRSSTPTTRESLQGLGLRLEKRKATVDLLVIDHLEKAPTEN